MFPHGLNARQLAVMVRLGMSPMRALQAATRDAAECLGWSEVGSLRPGSFADVVALPGHDLANLAGLTSPALVMKGGEVVADRR